MSNAKMLVPANLTGVQVPEGYMLVQQVKPNPNTASNSNPPPTFGKNWSRNQRKRERREQLAASGVMDPARNLTPISPPATAGMGSKPVVAQPMGSITAEAGLSPNICTGTERGKVDSESMANHPGYQTDDYAQLRANRLAVRNRDNLSAEMMLNNVRKLVNYVYSFTKVLASPDPGADFEVVKMWRYASNGAQVIAGGNIINVVIEILFFFKAYGNPVEGDEFLTPALDCIKLHPSMVRGEFLKGWVEEKIIQLPPEMIIVKLDTITKSETWAILRKFLNVLDNSGQLTARLPQSIYQPCYKFVGNNDELRSLIDAFNMGASTRYNTALNTLVKHVQRAHTPLLGVNQINILLKGTGISLNRFAGFAQAESTVAREKSNDSNYPSPLDLLNLCGLPLPAQYQAEENRRLMEKVDHLINVQIQTSQQINELRSMILQTSSVNQAVTAMLPDPSVDDRQSIDSLLADDEGQDMEQGKPITQHQDLNADQAYEADYALPPPTTDILRASVDSIMVAVDMHEQKQDKLEPQVPIDDVYEDLEHTMRT